MKLERRDHLAMTAIVFDSLNMMKRLRSTGLTEEQSVAIIDVARDALANVATKDDVEEAVQRGLHGLDPRFVSIDQRFSDIDRRFADIDRRFADIDHRFIQMDQRFASIDKHLGQIDQRFIILEQRMTIKLGSIVVLALGAFTALSKWIA